MGSSRILACAASELNPGISGFSSDAAQATVYRPARGIVTETNVIIINNTLSLFSYLAS